MWIEVDGAIIDAQIKIYLYFSASEHTSIYQAKELDANTESYIDLLAKGIGKPKEEIAKEIQRPKYFQAQEAIEYGIVDKILNSRESAFEKRAILFLYICSLLFISTSFLLCS